MRWTRRLVGSVVVLAAACSGGGGPPVTTDAPVTPIDAAPPIDAPGVHEHAARFVGLWALEQPFHALYEVTYYRLAADGVVTIGPSDPPNCSGHLDPQCVTGSVARCVPVPPNEGCTGTPTCRFGERWYSQGDRVVVFTGVCSDGVARDIAIELAADPSQDTNWGGAGGTLLSVGGDPAWSHDNWQWSFRKCPAGTNPGNCLPP